MASLLPSFWNYPELSGYFQRDNWKNSCFNITKFQGPKDKGRGVLQGISFLKVGSEFLGR